MTLITAMLLQLLQSRDRRTIRKQKQNKSDYRCATYPQWDRWHIRIPNPEDQRKLMELHRKSRAKAKSNYLRGRLLNEPFKVITEDKTAKPYLRESDSIVVLTRKIGILYNETVKTLNSYHTVATAQRMIRKLEVYSETPIKLQIQAIQLTEVFEKRRAKG